MRRWLFSSGLLAWAFLFYLLGSYRATMILVAATALFEVWLWSRMLRRTADDE
ncbi:hypothetical protein [Permianibacter aggregans]|uniref:Uncharacterized protein n=1 Tax=Permianibacter aggregans TaxID=1510150 RepID=A0A4R6UVA9_9GAMM|nr:hypothetical protein [Permianibacter aggregans]TDQ49365.1 hypothetical protein EV696_10469 [Permianibacter aggregans]